MDTIDPQVKVNSPEPGSFFTNAEVVLSGEIIDATEVILFVNGQAVPPGNINGNQINYPFTLAQGENNVTISAQDAANHSSQTTLTLFLDSINPQITISSPQSGSVTNKDKITISGSIEETYLHQVTLSGGSAGPVQGELIGSNFYFRDILLSDGENAFTVVCLDRAGNSGQSGITVVHDSQPPQLTVMEPVNGTMLPVKSVLVRGTVSDDGLKEVRVNNMICPLDNNQFNLVLELVEGSNMIEVMAYDLAGNLKTETLQVTVDTLSPNLNITSPTANAILNTPTVIVSGRVDDIHLSGGTVKVNGQNVPLSNNEFSVDAVALQEGKNEINVEVSDGVGNRTSRVIPLTLDIVSPSIVRVLPGDQTTHVPLSYHVSVELSEPIDETTLNSQDFYLQCNSEHLAGTILLEGNTCIFKPSALLPGDAEIEVHITNVIKDLAGNVISNPQVVTFFTRDKSAPSAPQLQPLGFQRLKALTLDFSGKTARKPVDISIPVPAGITDADIGKIFFAREVEVLGQKRVMIIDSAVISDGRIYSACEPFEDYSRQLDGSISVLRANFDTAIAFIKGTVASANTVVLAGEICYIPDNYYYVFPVPVNTQVNIVVQNLYTAETIYEKTTSGPSMAGQVYNFEKITNQSDKEPPMIVKSTGILTFGLDVTGQTVTNQGITITPIEDSGNVIGINISGAAGTAATKIEGDGTPFAFIRVYKLKKEEYSNKYIYDQVQGIEASDKGSFSQDIIDVKQGDRIIVTVEKGGIPLNQEFVLSFSEPLDINYKKDEVPISIYEYSGEDQTGEKIPTKAELLEINGQVTGTEVIVKLENKLNENQVYVLKTEGDLGNGLCDRAGNPLKISCNFRARRSYRLFEETGRHDDYDTVLIGSVLFVASGFEGIRIFDVSDPANIHLITTYTNFAGKVQGLARYRNNDDENSPYQLIAVGGGSACLGFIKVLDISNPDNIVQLKSQIISDNRSDSEKLPQGHPRYRI